MTELNLIIKETGEPLRLKGFKRLPLAADVPGPLG